MHGAYASFEENLKGSLTPGKLADCVVLEHDPRAVDSDRIKNIRVLRTVLGGNTTYETSAPNSRRPPACGTMGYDVFSHSRGVDGKNQSGSHARHADPAPR
jgi:hypothetical protein